MNFRVVGCDFRTTPVELREKLAVNEESICGALETIASLGECSIVLLNTCNRVELYASRNPDAAPFSVANAAELLSRIANTPADRIRPLLSEHSDRSAVRHLFRVAASLDSLVVGEGQIVGQVKQAFQSAQRAETVDPLLNAVFQTALRVAGRVRSETVISEGRISVSSVAVDYVRQVFESFTDKTILVIGAGKMGRLTLKHLRDLKPGPILVTNRSAEKASEVAADCGGIAVPWDSLDDALVRADIVLSTTGSPETIITAARYAEKIAPRRGDRQVIIDIAVPRDFDPEIHDGDRTCVFNIDDLRKVCDRNLARRLKVVHEAEAIVETEVDRFLVDWNRRRSGPVIGKLVAEADKLRGEIVQPLLAKFNGKLTEEDKKYLEGAFRLFQNKLLHPPKAALEEAGRAGQSGSLLEALKSLFRLKD